MKFILWLIAARGGSAVAKYNIGYIYKTGETVKKDIDKAAYWYWKAHEAGFLKAKKRLDEIYDQAAEFK